MADQVPTKTRSMVERMLDPEIQDMLTKRGRAFAEAINAAAETASGRAATTWRDAEPMRREAARAGREALRWGSRTWRNELRPGLRRLWSNRTAALSTAGAAVPVARELIDDAAVRLGIRKRREQRRWGAFFAGLLLGAVAGAIAAILTAPKAGREMRGELAGTARDAATLAREVAGRAREAAATAGEWVPIFQRPDADGEMNGEASAEAVEVPEIKPAAQARKRAASSAPIEEAEQPD
ncbi:MAG: YtxH domain-containing protein, partial [Chloroflexota bacterium]|nr:YtxH domain-containing protein [Chloroflexota bacterium]